MFFACFCFVVENVVPEALVRHYWNSYVCCMKSLPSCIVRQSAEFSGNWKARMMAFIMLVMPPNSTRLVVPPHSTWDNHKSEKHQSLPPPWDVAELDFLYSFVKSSAAKKEISKSWKGRP
jgi:hypothetical protein